MTQHIGIVACSAEGAALCYRTIAQEGGTLLGPHDHPEVSMHTHPLARYMSCIYANDWAGVAELMISSAEKLAKAGADFLICPDNTIHQAFELVAHRSPRPWPICLSFSPTSSPAPPASSRNIASPRQRPWERPYARCKLWLAFSRSQSLPRHAVQHP